MGVKVVLADGESLPVAIRRLRRRVSHSLPRFPVRQKLYYVKPSEKRRVKKYHSKRHGRMVARQQSDAHFGRSPAGSRFRSRLKITKLLLLK